MFPCKSIFRKFAVVTDDKGCYHQAAWYQRRLYISIWTTHYLEFRGNFAISLNPNFEYDFVKVPNGEIYVLAKELVVCYEDLPALRQLGSSRNRSRLLIWS